MKLLIANGANVHIKTKNNKSLLHIAIQKKYSLEAIELLIRSGIDINAKDKYGNTPLHYAKMIKNKYNETQIALDCVALMFLVITFQLLHDRVI